ncbi:unnamed protein product [Mytilus edulis]|uniref:Endonuclease/exonuclease/phosphatase domain-containing protein n=1 Tax=Mytilus edulis TaxID=6550 RepID=A0A8S3QRH6_MYTED|nr:unnamed protein product [Mytilus edulis]
MCKYINTFSDNFNVRLNSISCLNLDVLGIAETHLKKDEVLIVNDFKWFGHNRNGIHKNAKCGSGGVGFLIKDYLTEIFDIGILDQSFEGILWLYLHHRLSNFRFNICVCYLPPDHSTRQVDKELFFDTLISQVYEFQNDGLFYICGDFNSRCGDEYDYIPGVDCINMRSVIDFTRNSYCTTFIDFLTSSNCCMLNGRVGTNNDFTCVSSKGQSVVDYCITSYENLHFFQDFKVIRASDLIIKSKLNMTGLDARSIPDHSLLYCELNISASLPSCHTSGKRSPEFIKFDVKNIPSNFCHGDDIHLRLLDTINGLETNEVSQCNIDQVYTDFCAIVSEEMNQKLHSKVIVMSDSTYCNKRKRIKKPWWNDNLSVFFNDMCCAEKLWKKGKLSRVSCVELKSSFVSKRRVFDREVQKAKRKYWYTLQQELLLESKADQQTFWKKIGKIGIASERKTLIPMEVVDANGNVSSNVDDVLLKWKSDYADLLNQTGNQVTTDRNIPVDQSPAVLTESDFLLTEEISFEEVFNVVCKSKRGKASGVDNIPADSCQECLIFILKNGKVLLVHPLPDGEMGGIN